MVVGRRIDGRKVEGEKEKATAKERLPGQDMCVPESRQGFWIRGGACHRIPGRREADRRHIEIPRQAQAGQKNPEGWIVLPILRGAKVCFGGFVDPPGGGQRASKTGRRGGVAGVETFS